MNISVLSKEDISLWYLTSPYWCNQNLLKTYVEQYHQLSFCYIHFSCWISYLNLSVHFWFSYFILEANKIYCTLEESIKPQDFPVCRTWLTQECNHLLLLTKWKTSNYLILIQRFLKMLYNIGMDTNNTWVSVGLLWWVPVKKLWINWCLKKKFNQIFNCL